MKNVMFAKIPNLLIFVTFSTYNPLIYCTSFKKKDDKNYLFYIKFILKCIINNRKTVLLLYHKFGLKTPLFIKVPTLNCKN